jgi:hypothetical protein
MADFKWTRPPSQAWNRQLYKAQLMDAVEKQLWYWSPQIEASAKENAEWTDRTANARQSLASFVYRDGDKIILILKQQMDYGKFLELANQGKYAIVLVTLEQYYARVWGSVREMVQ